MSGLEEMHDAAYRRYVGKRIPAVIDRIEEVGLPSPGEQLRLVTRRKFNAIEFLAYVAERERIVDFAAAIYSINFNAAKMIVEMLDDGRIGEAEILMSNLRNKAYREKEVATKELFESHPRIRLWFCSSHAKVMACRTEAGNYYTIEGSGNHANNSRVEQYVIDNDREIYEFTRGWMADIREYLAGSRELEVCFGEP